MTSRSADVRRYLDSRERAELSDNEEEAGDFDEGDDDQQLAMDGLVNFVSHLAV